MRVVAVVLNYRDAEMTARCVYSLHGQIVQTVVVDNSESEEHHLHLIRLFDGAPSCRVIRAPANLGFAAGVALGVESVDAADAFLFINSDAIAEPGMVETLQLALDAHGGKALVSAVPNAGGAGGILWYQRFLALTFTQQWPGTIPYISGACMLVPADFARSHPFDARFFMYGEDIAFSSRARADGFGLVLAPEARFVHAGSGSSRRGSLFYEYHVMRGHLLLANALASRPRDRFLMRLGRTISLPVRATWRSLSSQSLTPWKGLLRAISGRAPQPPAR
jgi:N-acetylglucosaminyl-diphospho-decaprenol L-rhamnosyltransferase